MKIEQKQAEFERKYLNKKIFVKSTCPIDIPRKVYTVTAALLDFENDELGNAITVFAIKAIDYNKENKHWFTLKYIDNSENKEVLEEHLSDFLLLE